MSQRNRWAVVVVAAAVCIILAASSRAEEPAAPPTAGIPGVNIQAAGQQFWAGRAGPDVDTSAGLTLKMYGFVETDFINDSTQGLLEEQDNVLIARPNTYAGGHAQSMMSIRNSRLGFDLGLPVSDTGWTAKGKFEFDFLGNQGISTVPGTVEDKATTVQSEANFFNNPTVRIRHAYLELLNTTKDSPSGWDFKLGQTWSLFGWQPYYFPAEVPIQPAVGQLYRRFPQMRAMYTEQLGDESKLELAADAAKPDEMRSELPEGHAGLRLSTKKLQAAVLCGGSLTCADNKTNEDLSAALSSAWIPIRTDQGDRDGWAGAADMFVPILPTHGSSRANSLSLTGEASVGRGIGGLELASLSFGLPANVTAGGTPLDSGIASLNKNGQAELIEVSTLRADLMYVPPFGKDKWNADLGVAQVDCLNVDDYAFAPTTVAPKMQYGYAAISYDWLKWVRTTVLYATTTDTYQDGIHATDHRYWMAWFFMF
jgi:hypothetical protein